MAPEVRAEMGRNWPIYAYYRSDAPEFCSCNYYPLLLLLPTEDNAHIALGKFRFFCATCRNFRAHPWKQDIRNAKIQLLGMDTLAISDQKYRGRKAPYILRIA